MSIVITNPDVDHEVVALTNEAYEMVTPHWQTLIPPIEIVVANKPFNRIRELREFCKIQNEELGWKTREERHMWEIIRVICPEPDEKKTVFWIRSSHFGMSPSAYYFQKEFFSVIAQVIWNVSERLRNEARKQTAGTHCEPEGLTYLVFRDTFSRFFLNPNWLKERREEAWDFIMKLDESLSGTLHSA